MRRLYFRVYLYFVGILVSFALVSAFAWHLTADESKHNRYVEGIAALVGAAIPETRSSPVELNAAVRRLARQFDADIAIFDAAGEPLAAAGEAVPPPDPTRGSSGWIRARGHGVALRLPDGRWLVARDSDPHGPRLLWMFALLAVLIAIGAYPLARRVTRRLERLQTRVEALGGGDLTARVEIEGNDEVADLARSFNRAAERIERLVESERMMVASASHELRTPLTRIRMAMELIGGNERTTLREQVASDIVELDELIEELLLASRLQTQTAVARDAELEILGLVAEEGARVGAEVRGDEVTVLGDARLIRYLVRNLFENARRHGDPDTIEARVAAGEQGGVTLSVSDRGPGIPPAERERVFEPFYRPAGMHEEGQGVGLGLYLVRQIARLHGGDARCEADGRGAIAIVVTLRSGGST